MPEGSRESKASILIVEDEVIIASDLKIRLLGLGYTVCGMAASSDRALALVEQFRPDLVMMDIVLSGKRDGIETAKLVRAQWGIPVVFLTAYADTDRLDRAKLTYPFGYLMKPFQDRDLKITVEMALYVASVDAERRKAERALSMSEKHYRALFSSINDAILVHEIDDDGSPGHFIEVNQLACDRLGYTREELLQLTPADISTPQEFARLADNRRTLVSRDQVVFETMHKTRDGRQIPVESSVAIFHHDQRRTAVSVSRDITERKRAEGELERRLVALTQPVDQTHDIAFDDLFNLEDIQELQDLFAASTGVASIITRTDGTPITSPSRFCRLCQDIIRQTEQGRANCFESDAVLGQYRQEGPLVRPCLSGGLWDAGAAISVGGRHLANWLIGQVRDETQTEDHMREYARVIGADPELVVEAFREVPAMSRDQFQRVAQALYVLANQLSNTAYQNVQQSRFITDLRKAEEALRESEEKLRLFIEHAPAALAMFDREMRYLAVSRRWMADYQLGDRDIIGQCHYDVFPEIPDSWKTVHRRGLAGEVVQADEDCFLRADGTVQWQHWVVRPWYLVDGEVGGIIIFTDDITERKNTENALRESEENFSQAFRTAPYAITISRASDGRFLDVNEAFTSITGYTREEALADSSLGLGLWIDEADRRQVVADLQEGRRVAGREFQFRAKNGGLVIGLFSAHLTHLNNNTYILSSIDDITDRKLVESEKERLAKQLQQAQKMEAVGILAGGIAHDFNNLLQAINGYTQLLLMDVTPYDAPYQNLKAILDAGKRAAELVRQLLLFSRKVDTTRKPVELNHEVEQARGILERIIPKMVDIEFIPGQRLRHIMADPVQIRQMLLNLGTNAAEAMPDGGTLIIETQNVQLNETYACRQLGITPGGYALLTVTDSGQGMGQDTVDKIFDPFFTTKAIGRGTGLGLASVYGIVKGHGGHITCSSEIGQGTIFRVYLPAVETAGASGINEVRTAPTKSGAQTILIVDDEEPIREFASQALARFGYTVQTATTGEKALEIHANHPGGIDLIIIDIGRPDLGGLKCLEEILKVDQSAKILIARGYSIEGHLPQAMVRGAVGFVAKPYQLLDLLNTVRSVLDND